MRKILIMLSLLSVLLGCSRLERDSMAEWELNEEMAYRYFDSKETLRDAIGHEQQIETKWRWK